MQAICRPINYRLAVCEENWNTTSVSTRVQIGFSAHADLLGVVASFRLAFFQTITAWIASSLALCRTLSFKSSFLAQTYDVPTM